MNKLILILLAGLILITLSCKHRNRLKADETFLSEEILKEEAEKAEASQTFSAEVGKSTGESFMRMEEDRSPDATNPPIVLDILSGRENPQKVKVSDLFSEIKYIKLEHLPDSAFYERGIDVLISDKFIYGYSMNGIAQYSLDGYFIKYICKNEAFYTKMDRGIMITSEQYNMFIGATNPKLKDGKLYYKYENRPAKSGYLMEYDELAGMETLSLPVQQENSQNIRGLGNPVMDLLANTRNYASNEMMTSPTEINPLGNGLVGFSMRGKPMTRQSNFVTVTSLSGDTVCSMKDYDPINNYSKSVGRGAEDAYNYYLDGFLHLRQVYNDTIYRLIPPNQLIPKYILDFGEFGIESSLEGMDPGFSLENKFVPEDFLETSRFIFFTYTKNYPCPNTAKNGTLKYSRLIYNKKVRKIDYIYVDEQCMVTSGSSWPSAPDLNIENDLDDNPFFWPVDITSSGLPFSAISGKILFEKFESRDFAGYKNLSDKDFVIALYK
ncbi:MAG: DUF4933 domain-containing protein [Prolixibacteraceae bacterium]|nr:DUF4933 domain-containing protein [Prolixibacteraceae bacterium]MBN2774073.1 DUF4933 domain-containing protein [Prolixibacteraceae bacterium]